MKNKNRVWIMSLLLTAALAVSLSGCGKEKVPETEKVTEKVTETEKATETEKITETEKATETEKTTEKESETETAKALTAEEEKAQETELKANKTYYASDDINVRSDPSTEADIISSYIQGDEVIVSAETRDWYKVEKDGYSGYVYKQNLSETAVEPKTDAERAEAQNNSTASGNTSSDTSSVDLEYNVQTFADSFPIQLSADANMRSVPGTDGDVLYTVGSGSSVTAIGETDRWYKVEFDGYTGYINKNLVQ
ncbi:MAG: SH3 domain-containing protein [Lachnospiraceae bacterium]|nr:SH3 domain-containing protein [Lachnospiraceae bacterium]MDD3795820.1 SH3 domain-containing protein [Lachnospiraceae bacterium]